MPCRRMIPSSGSLQFSILLAAAITAGIVGVEARGAEKSQTVQPILFGAYAKEAHPTDLTAIEEFERDAGKKVSVIMCYQAWGAEEERSAFDPKWMTSIRQHGAIPMITWTPWAPQHGAEQPKYALRNIVDGKFDRYIRDFALAAKEWHHPFFLRFAHEMNGDWYSWSEAVNGNAPGEYVKAWRHVHRIFTEAGVRNVTWVWCPSRVGCGKLLIKNLDELYPGDEFVDWAGMDGYSKGGKEGTSFPKVFDKLYTKITEITRKPIIIAETACGEGGEGKPAWIKTAMAELPKLFPQVGGVMWFNSHNDPASDWRIESSPQAQQAFAKAVSSPIYTANAFGNYATSPIRRPVVETTNAPAPKDSGSGTRGSANKIQGPLSTDGMKIVDRQGREVLFRGANASGLEWGAGHRRGEQSDKEADNRAYGAYEAPAKRTFEDLESWGFNMVRVPIAWANVESEPGKWNEKYLRQLDTVVRECEEHKLAVIFSFHQWGWSPAFRIPKPGTGEFIRGNGWPVWLYPADWLTTDPVTGKARRKALAYDHEGQEAAAREFFTNERRVEGRLIQDRFLAVWDVICRRYADSPTVVGVDIINEPYQNGGHELEDLYQRAGELIHKRNPGWLLVFEHSLSHPKLDAKHFLDAPGFPRRQAVFSSHLYPAAWDKSDKLEDGKQGKILAKERLEENLAYSTAWGVPFWVGEFHLIMNQDELEAGPSVLMLGFMHKDGPHGNGTADISWSYWAYQRDRYPLNGEGIHESARAALVEALRKGF